MTSHVVLDIETVPDFDFLADETVKAALFDDIKAPKNYKDEQKIADYIEKRREEKIAEAALSPVTGRIAAIGWSHLDEMAPTTIVMQDERVMLKALLDDLSCLKGDYILCGFNVKRFDLPFLLYRCAVLGIRRVQRAGLPLPTDWRRIFDVFEVVQREGAMKLHLRRFFGDELMKTAEGADVADMDPTQLADYVRQDVVCTRELVKRFEWIIPDDTRRN